MCGIVGIVGTQPVSQAIYDALTVLQHRGQDAAGIMTEADDGSLCVRKKNGLVRDVFQQRHMLRMTGNTGIGHVRYPTAGCSAVAEAQPFYVNSPYGICLAHNGNITNTNELKSLLVQQDKRHLNTGSDSEVLLNVFAHELQGQSGPLSPNAVFAAVAAVHERCRGGYAVVAMILGHGIVAFRDPHGIRPVVLGRRESSKGIEYMVASESVALDALGFELIRDILPGEGVYIEKTGKLHARQCCPPRSYTPCVFEYVYFARPDSIIDKISVYKARMRMGEVLADKILRQRPDHDIDVVIPIPDSSRTSAFQVAYDLGVKYREGFIKNRYIGRTFIMPGQEMRERSVRRKLNAIDLEFRDKVVLLVDDSIVRGTTSQQIIDMAREAGARKVYFASASPPVRYPNVYGIDMPAAAELIASGHTDEEVCQLIGADWLVYQDLEDLIKAVRYDNGDIASFDTSCFSGQYITGDVTAEYLHRIESERSDFAKAEREARLSEVVSAISDAGVA